MGRPGLTFKYGGWDRQMCLWSDCKRDIKDINRGLVTQMVKNLPAMQENWVGSLDQEDPLEKGMATHSSILAWRIPWTEEPGGLQPMGLQRFGHDWEAERGRGQAWGLAP